MHLYGPLNSFQGPSCRTSSMWKPYSGGIFRRLNAVGLLVLLLAPFWLGLIAPETSTEAYLPACCRVHGKHQCAMRMGDDAGVADSTHKAFSRISERCPCPPASPAVFHTGSFGEASDVTKLQCNLAAEFQCTSLRSARILRRSGKNSQRGPPVSNFSV